MGWRVKLVLDLVLIDGKVAREDQREGTYYHQRRQQVIGAAHFDDENQGR